MEKEILKKQIIGALAPLPYLSFAYLFGSQASGTTGVLSDVDIAVFFTEPWMMEKKDMVLNANWHSTWNRYWDIRLTWWY